jgi:hypothetical protein
MIFPDLPPGKALCEAVGAPETDYPILGVTATLFVEAVFNGAFCGIIAWIIFTIGSKVVRPKPKTPQQ